MEAYETIAWVAIGFIPTLLGLETASRIARDFKLCKRKETALTVRKRGVDRN
jgi:hypothetical protein